MPFKIDEISFQSGVKLTLSPITVIVGPNNSGKTRLLKEFKQYLSGNNASFKIIEKMTSKPRKIR